MIIIIISFFNCNWGRLIFKQSAYNDSAPSANNFMIFDEI